MELRAMERIFFFFRKLGLVVFLIHIYIRKTIRTKLYIQSIGAAKIYKRPFH